MNEPPSTSSPETTRPPAAGPTLPDRRLWPLGLALLLVGVLLGRCTRNTVGEGSGYTVIPNDGLLLILEHGTQQVHRYEEVGGSHLRRVDSFDLGALGDERIDLMFGNQ